MGGISWVHYLVALPDENNLQFVLELSLEDFKDLHMTSIAMDHLGTF
jgi:hypothetical protein